jgi:hypothetical protein
VWVHSICNHYNDSELVLLASTISDNRLRILRIATLTFPTSHPTTRRMTLADSVSPPAPELEAPLSPTTSREQRSPMHIWCMTQLLIDRGVEEMKELYELRHEVSLPS